MSVFVRWKRRPGGLRRFGGRFGDLLVASLVCSVRVGGKPRQKALAYLGSFREGLMGAQRRALFWQSADEALNRAGLAAADREKAEAALLAKVPRPTPAEAEEDRQASEAALASLVASIRGAP